MPRQVTISAKDLSTLSSILKPKVLSLIQQKGINDKFFLVKLDNISIGIYVD